MSKVARSADLRMLYDCESFEETEQSVSHKVSKGTFDTYLIILKCEIIITIRSYIITEKTVYPQVKI